MGDSKLIILEARQCISNLIVDTRDMEHSKIKTLSEDTVSNLNEHPVECRKC